MATRGALKRRPENDESILRAHLRPAFGEFTLRQITSERIAEFNAELSATRAPLTVRNVLNLLGAMLRQAVEWGWIETLPRIRKPKVRLFNKDYRYLRTDEEIEQFLDAAKEEESPTVAPMYATGHLHRHARRRAGRFAVARCRFQPSIDYRATVVQRPHESRRHSPCAHCRPASSDSQRVATRVRLPTHVSEFRRSDVGPTRARFCRSATTGVGSCRFRCAIRPLSRITTHVRIPWGHEGGRHLQTSKNTRP